MSTSSPNFSNFVNCRIGSLEICISRRVECDEVNCRIGSLEMRRSGASERHIVNCRIGRLEVPICESVVRLSMK